MVALQRGPTSELARTSCNGTSGPLQRRVTGSSARASGTPATSAILPCSSCAYCSRRSAVPSRRKPAPAHTHAADPLGRHFTPGAYSLTEREREIAVLVINNKWRFDYPTAAHERRGKEVGLAQEIVEAIIAGRPASFTDPREQVVYEVAMALANDRIVPDGLYERAVKLLGHERITDMIVLMGYYTAVSLTMNFYAVPANSPGIAR